MNTGPLVTAVLVVVLVVACYLFLWKTRIGKAIRAMGQNRTGAALVVVVSPTTEPEPPAFEAATMAAR